MKRWYGARQVTTDVVALLDEWAARFFEELDYVREGQNATRFAAQMAKDLPQVRGDACGVGVFSVQGLATGKRRCVWGGECLVSALCRWLQH